MTQSQKNFLYHNGKINLEQQRKRAKALLKQLKAGCVPEQLSLLRHANRSLSELQLSDAQWLIAHQLGFSSWPKLKEHIDAIAFAQRHPDFNADDEASTQHWRCGNDIAHSLNLAGFKGSFHMFTDPLSIGPVPDVIPKELRVIRNEFISSAFSMSIDEVRQRTDREYNSLEQLTDARNIALWCEADAYDQLFLIRILASLPRLPERLALIEVDSIPGVDRFIGLGQLAPEVLAWLWPRRRELQQDALHLAGLAWNAYCSSSPVRWALLAQGATPPLPLLAPALLRQLQELPSIRNGLSLTEKLSLQIISEFGEMSFGEVFSELTDNREPLPYLGDLMFHAIMRPLIDVETPLIIESGSEKNWTERTLRLTPLGYQILAEERYWFDLPVRDRWIGGVQIQAKRPHWALDDTLQPVWRS